MLLKCIYFNSTFTYLNVNTLHIRDDFHLKKKNSFNVLKLFHRLLFRLWGLTKAAFKNISVISWRSVLLVEETGIPGENHQSDVSH